MCELRLRQDFGLVQEEANEEPPSLLLAEHQVTVTASMLHHVMHDTASHTASEERAASSEQAASADARTHCGCRKGELVTASTSVRQSQLQGLVLSASATSGNTLEIISCTRLSAVSVPLDYQVDKHTHTRARTCE